MSLELLKSGKITLVTNSAAAGTSEVDTSVLDMAGFDAVCFVAILGTVVDASVLTLSVKENSASSTSSPTPTAVSGGATAAVTASTSSNTLLITDVIRPSKRYVFAALTRTAQNATVQAIIAIQYRAHEQPVTQGATVLASALSTPEV